MADGKHRVLVIGGGFGGLAATRALADADVQITLVDRTNHHLFQPLLYQVAAGILPPGLIAPALRQVVRKQANVRVLLADVQDIDLDRREVQVREPDGRPAGRAAVRHAGGRGRGDALLFSAKTSSRSSPPG